MNDPWRYFDPPAPSGGGGGRYGIQEVLEAERWAWAGVVRGARAQFFYDGIDFWQQLTSGERRAVSRLDAPASGWWHRPQCSCALCQDHAPSARAKQTAAGRP